MTIVASGWEDTYYFRFRLKGVYDTSSGDSIEFWVWTAENLQNQSNILTYIGDKGDEYEKIKNEHMGLFKIQDSYEDESSTTIYRGNLWEILYFL